MLCTFLFCLHCVDLFQRGDLPGDVVGDPLRGAAGQVPPLGRVCARRSTIRTEGAARISVAGWGYFGVDLLKNLFLTGVVCLGREVPAPLLVCVGDEA